MPECLLKCSRCGKEIENGKEIRSNIGYRTREWREGRFGRMEYKAVFKQEIRVFCSSKCSCDEQAAMEG